MLLSGTFLLPGLGRTSCVQRPSGPAIALLVGDGAFWGVASLFAAPNGT